MSAESRPPAPPSRRPWVVLLLVAIAAGVAWFTLKGGDQVAGPRYRTATLEKRTVIRRVESSGHLAVTRRVEVPSLLQGRMLKANVKMGAQVKAGDVLATMEPLPTPMNADVARAQLAAAAGGVAQAEAEVRALTDQLKQALELQKKGLVGAAEIQQTRAKLEAATAALRAAGAQRTAAQANLNSAQRLASNADLVAPIDGVVLVAPDEEGSLIGPTSGPIFVLAGTLDRLLLAAEVSELDVALLRADQPAEISVDALPGEHFPGKVVYVGLTPARAGSLVTYPVTYELENPGQRLRPGLSATARVEADRAADAFAVPEAALRYAPPDAPAAEDRSRVFRVTPAGVLESVPVRAGLSDGAFTVVMSAEKAPPLAIGDAIVIGAAKGNEGTPAGGINLSGKKP